MESNTKEDFPDCLEGGCINSVYRNRIINLFGTDGVDDIRKAVKIAQRNNYPEENS